ncbi:MAG: tetratricopeptide repeat protein [Clostridium sp.]|uniref:tetratricopeptide repeat protein n=1 Tax=Clostridium sp. TaxID=1506 RepID=UPI0039E76573
MNKSNVYYGKALNYYQKGYIEKAIEFCEKSISDNIKNKAAIDLKGLLYYLKGDITNCRALWKLNSQVNNDKVAKKYLEGIDKDQERFKLYVEAVKKIKDMKINEAIGLLSECDSSDFNTIDVNNYLCVCYIKQGNFQKAKEKLEKVMKIDKYNYMALENRKTLVEYGEIKIKFFNKKYFYAASLITICIVVVLSVSIGMKFLSNLRIASSEPKKSITLKTNNKSSSNPSGSSIEEKKDTNLQFPYDDVKNAIDSKDYEKTYSYIEQWKNENVRINYKEILSQGEKLLTEEGVVYFYKQGTVFFNNKDYNNAVKEFLKAFNYGNSNYLYPHIIYFIGESYKNLGDYENAINFYSIYDTNFSQGDYEETVLYNMAIINKNIDINKAKQYASRLSDNYPHSIYNNSNIKDIVKN